MEGKSIINFSNQYVGLLGHNAYVARPYVYSTINYDELVAYASKAAGIPTSDMYVALEALVDAFAYFLCNGHAFKLDGVGTFSLSLSAATADPTAEEMITGADAVKSVGVNFLPDKKLKQILASMSIETRPTNPNDLTEYADSSLTKLVVGDFSYNLLNDANRGSLALVAGQKVQVNGYNLGTFNVKFIDKDDNEVVVALECDKAKTQNHAVGIVPVGTNMAIVKKVVAFDTTYLFPESSAYAKFNGIVLNGNQSVNTGSYVFEYIGNGVQASDIQIDGAAVTFDSVSSSRLAKTISVSESKTMTIKVKEQTYTITFVESATNVPNITSLTANGVTVANGGSSTMRQGQTYNFVAIGENLGSLSEADIILPEGTQLLSSSYQANRIQFSVQYGGTAGDIKIGSYFTIAITTATAAASISDIGGIANGGTATVAIDDMETYNINGSGLGDQLYYNFSDNAVDSASGISKTSAGVWQLNVSPMGALNGWVKFYSDAAKTDCIFTLNIVAEE